jgi:3-methyladenine DNA glycosylase AlkC
MSEKFSLKDELFNPPKVHKIASEIREVFKSFEQELFEKDVLSRFGELELKERIYHIREILAKYLPYDYKEATTILLKALPPQLDSNLTDNDYGDFIYASYGDFVVSFGCKEEHLKFSLKALQEITKRFSVEFAIRDFINLFPKESFEMLRECSLSNNYHERRLASEGTRPKLPWAKKLTTAYDKPLKLLENLYFDKTRYVTRSVANHLNDISKIDALLVIETLKRWQSSGKQSQQEMSFIMTHALRTLIKEGNPKALELLGYSFNPKITISNFKVLDLTVKVGDSLNFLFNIKAKADELLMIDYIIYFQTKSGRCNPKVHKIKKINIKKDELMSIKKRHPFRANMSTRKLYKGEHKLELQINGKIYYSTSFKLEI